MPSTRNLSLSLNEQMEVYKNSYYNESTLKSIDWKPVLIINVQGALKNAIFNHYP